MRLNQSFKDYVTAICTWYPIDLVTAGPNVTHPLMIPLCFGLPSAVPFRVPGGAEGREAQDSDPAAGVAPPVFFCPLPFLSSYAEVSCTSDSLLGDL